jgi:hypothetical protein
LDSSGRCTKFLDTVLAPYSPYSDHPRAVVTAGRVGISK